MNWNKNDWKRATTYITRGDGSRFTPDELKAAFIEELSKGHEVIPTCQCDNFDYKKGCLGHEMEEAILCQK
jgi:hypothetical protein